MSTTMSPVFVPGQRQPAAGRPAVNAEIRAFRPDETRPERCNSGSSRTLSCKVRPDYRTTITRPVVRLGKRAAETVIDRNACAAHAARFVARYGLDLPPVTS